MTVDIKDLRKRLGDGKKPISQKELGEKLGGVNQSTISRIEAGEVEPTGPLAILLQMLDQNTPRARSRRSGSKSAEAAA